MYGSWVKTTQIDGYWEERGIVDRESSIDDGGGRGWMDVVER